MHDNDKVTGRALSPLAAFSHSASLRKLTNKRVSDHWFQLSSKPA